MKKERYKAKIFIGIILMVFGLIFGGFPALSFMSGEFNPVIMIFVLIGVCIFVGGIVFIINEIKRSKIINELIYRNEYIYAEFDSVKAEYHSDEDSSYYTYYALLKYCDEYGKPVFFKSEEYSSPNKVPFKPGDSVKVFVDMANPKIYMVSLNDTIHSDDPKYISIGKEKNIFGKTESVVSIITGVLFTVVPLAFAVFMLLAIPVTVPVLLFFLLFVGLFIAVGAAQIVKGIKELTKKQ